MSLCAPLGAAQAPLGMNEQPIHDAARMDRRADELAGIVSLWIL